MITSSYNLMELSAPSLCYVCEGNF